MPRLVLLTEIPPGLHGDEGWTGIDARRVLTFKPSLVLKNVLNDEPVSASELARNQD